MIFIIEQVFHLFSVSTHKSCKLCSVHGAASSHTNLQWNVVKCIAMPSMNVFCTNCTIPWNCLPPHQPAFYILAIFYYYCYCYCNYYCSSYFKYLGGFQIIPNNTQLIKSIIPTDHAVSSIAAHKLYQLVHNGLWRVF